MYIDLRVGVYFPALGFDGVEGEGTVSHNEQRTACYEMLHGLFSRYSAPCSHFAVSTELQQNVRTYGQQHSSVYGDVTSETDIRRTQVNGSQEGVNLKRNNGFTFLFT